MILAKMKSNRNRKCVRRKKKTQSDIKSDRKLRLNSAAPDGLEILYALSKTIDHFCPNLWQQLELLVDPRQGSRYSIGCIILSGIFLFLFKQESRNEFNQLKKQQKFARNYKKLFGMALPHMDTVNTVMKALEPCQLERLKATLVKQLLEKKIFDKFKLFGRHVQVVIDATRVQTFSKKYCDECLSCTHTFYKLTKSGYKQLVSQFGSIVEGATVLVDTSIKGDKKLRTMLTQCLGSKMVYNHFDELQTAFKVKKTTQYFHAVLEAKIVSSNGFCISIATEWLCNTKGIYDKQDCERNAFKRLAQKLKSYFPRLPICIIADGLYPNAPFFQICKDNNWRYIITYRQGSLKTLRREIEDLMPLNSQNTFDEPLQHKEHRISNTYTWISALDYKDHKLQWVQCQEEKIFKNQEVSNCCFEYLTDMSATDFKEVKALIFAGRLRQKIENEGFNIQKNHGFKLQHKYSRTCFNALKNYYQCLQLAHLFDQLLYLSKFMKEALKLWRTTLKHCMKQVQAALVYSVVDERWLDQLKAQRTQFRY